MIAPTVFFGWILLILIAVYGIPDVTQLIPFVQEIIESSAQLTVLAFLAAVVPPSRGDIHHFRNAPRIREVGSLNMEVWEHVEQ